MKQKIMYFAPSIGWILICSVYFYSSVGFGNLFAQLPFEVFVSLFVVSLVPAGNWLSYILDMRVPLKIAEDMTPLPRGDLPIPKGTDVIDEAIETMAKVSGGYQEVYGLPDDKKTIPEVLAEQKRSGEDIPVTTLWDGMNKALFPSKTA